MSTPTENSAHNAAILAQAAAFCALRSLMGHVQDGSDTPICLYQDDATRSYFVRVGPSGSPRARHYHGESLQQAVEAAVKAEGRAS